MLAQDKTGMLSARFNIRIANSLGAETVAMIGIKRFRSEIDPPSSYYSGIRLFRGEKTGGV